MSRLDEADRLQLLQGLRLKGRSETARIAAAWGVDEAAAADGLVELVAQGLVEEKRGFFSLRTAGESLRGQLMARERAGLDGRAMEALYAEFCAVDPLFKQLVTDVQLGEIERGDAALHLAPLHRRLQPLLDRAGALLPRLAPYASRFGDALAALQQGDPRYLASPRVESYHGIWFEFHEELIQASGRTRVEESSASGDR